MTTKQILSLVLLLISALLSIKHGWDTFQPMNAAQAKTMATLGITPSVGRMLGVVSIVIALLLLLPQTFFLGNVLNAICIVCIMALALRAGNITMVLIEIPFLVLPLVLIWLKYPFKS